MSETSKNLFNSESQYVLFSGTSLNGNGAFRHLNDLFIILFALIQRKIPKERIYIVIDKRILENLDTKTNSKIISINNVSLTFSEYITNNVDNIIDVINFEKEFIRGNNDLVFIASGHGAVQGLSIENNKTFLSSDYFENICTNDENSTYLIMSQCQAGAFHHLDTRKDICVIGASEYQNSISIPLNSMVSDVNFIHNFSFWNGIAINPFIFSLFIVILNINNENIINNSKKNIINIFKFVASSTISYVSAQINNRKIVIPKDLVLKSKGDFEILVENITIQQPFLLNKILASKTILS